MSLRARASKRGRLRPETVITRSPEILILAIGAATGVATLLGGAAALKLRRGLSLILGLAAGAVIGVALFDLLPEALELRPGLPAMETLGVTGIGFAGYMAVERLLGAASKTGRGHLGPAALTLHSLMDGLAIGLAFQVSAGIGMVVAAAVLAHDLADGINTVTLSLAGGGGPRRAKGWLVADAVAPLVGIVAASFFRPQRADLGAAMALFGGFFLYIGASDLTPSSYRTLPRPWTSLATVAGMAAIYLAVRLASG